MPAKHRVFPQEVYVRWNSDGVGDDEDAYYLTADPDFEGMSHGDRVAVYELRDVKTLRVTRELGDRTR